MLESAERRLLIVQHSVDRNAAGKDLRGDAARARYVGPAYEGVKAEIRVIGDSDRIFVGFVGDDTQNGAENLLPGNRHVVRHINKDRGLHEVTRIKAGRMTLAADEHIR